MSTATSILATRAGRLTAEVQRWKSLAIVRVLADERNCGVLDLPADSWPRLAAAFDEVQQVKETSDDAA